MTTPTCGHCHAPLEGRGAYCSDTCRKRAARRVQRGLPADAFAGRAPAQGPVPMDGTPRAEALMMAGYEAGWEDATERLLELPEPELAVERANHAAAAVIELLGARAVRHRERRERAEGRAYDPPPVPEVAGDPLDRAAHVEVLALLVAESIRDAAAAGDSPTSEDAADLLASARADYARSWGDHPAALLVESITVEEVADLVAAQLE